MLARHRSGEALDHTSSCSPRSIVLHAYRSAGGTPLGRAARGRADAQVEGVAGYIHDGNGGPAHIPPQVVADLIARAPDGFLQLPETPCPFRHGERIMVRGGGLIAAYYGIFQHALDGQHAIIEQEWLGRLVPVTVRLNDLDPMQPRAAPNPDGGDAQGTVNGASAAARGSSIAQIDQRPALRDHVRTRRKRTCDPQ